MILQKNKKKAVMEDELGEVEAELKEMYDLLFALEHQNNKQLVP